jgi:hypothetical protein
MDLKRGELQWLIHVRTAVHPHIIPKPSVTQAMRMLKANSAVPLQSRFVKTD